MIQLDHSAFANFASVLAHSHQVGADVVIALDADDSITLLHGHAQNAERGRLRLRLGPSRPAARPSIQGPASPALRLQSALGRAMTWALSGLSAGPPALQRLPRRTTSYA